MTLINAQLQIADFEELIQSIVGAMVSGNTETNITVTYDSINKKLDFVASSGSGYTQEEIEDFVGAMVASNTETGITVTYDDTTGKLNFVADVTQTELDAIQTELDLHETGWTAVTETWTRAANHTFNISGDVTAIYRKGTKVRYKDGGSYEYGVVQSAIFSIDTTTVNLVINSSYEMAAATITDRYISYIENPEGFPQWFNWPLVFTNLTVGNGTLTARWRATPLTVYFEIDMLFGSTSSISGEISFSPPTLATLSGNFPPIGLAVLLDSGVGTYVGQVFLLNNPSIAAIRVIGASETYGRQLALSSTVPFTWTTSDRIMVNGFYGW